MSATTDARQAYAQASRQLLRNTVLSAVDVLAAERPFTSVTMAQVAAAAGVSRQTLYNEFGNRDELAQAYVLWAAEHFLDDVERTITAHSGSLREALTAAFESFLDLAIEHPLVRALEATTGAEGLHALVATVAGLPVLVGAADRLVQIAAVRWPEIPEADARLFSETVVRLAISHLTVPTVAPAAAALQVDRVLGPFLAEIEPPTP